MSNVNLIVVSVNTAVLNSKKAFKSHNSYAAFVIMDDFFLKNVWLKKKSNLRWGNTIKIVVSSDIDNGVSSVVSNLGIHCIGKLTLTNDRLRLGWQHSHLRFDIHCATIPTLELNRILRITK